MPAANGVILISTPDPEYNTTAPTGDLAGSGWDLQGEWGIFLGTPIAPYYFITAHHVGGAVGDPFLFNGVTYTTSARVDDLESDLSIWQVNGAFPSYAQLYSGSTELGASLVVFGRGTQRGDAVSVAGPTGPEMKGWLWGPADSRKRWGANQVDSIVNGDQLGPPGGATQGRIGDLLKATFDLGAGPNEAHLSVGDSGGAVFIRDGATWKLAGINYAVNGPYNLTNSGSGFEAAVYDEGGLYTGSEGDWTLTPELTTPQPGAFYSTRISAHLAWIQSVVLPPNSQVPILQSAPSVSSPYSNETGAIVDTTALTITIQVPLTDRFYRLSANAPLKIAGATRLGTNLVLGYQLDPAQFSSRIHR